MSTFEFSAAECVPFRDKAEVARVRAITREDITKHRNPDLKIEVIPGEDLAKSGVGICKGHEVG